MGAIGDRAKQYIPFTWDALSRDSKYGDSALQGRVDAAKYDILGSSMPAEGLESTLDLRVQEFLAKKSVVAIIPAAIEFWMNQPISQNLTGTQESTSYTDRVRVLKDLLGQLLQEIAATEVDLPIPVVFNKGAKPMVSDGNSEILRSANPHTFPQKFDPTVTI